MLYDFSFFPFLFCLRYLLGCVDYQDFLFPQTRWGGLKLTRRKDGKMERWKAGVGTVPERGMGR